MSEQNPRYKLFLDEVPGDDPDVLRAIKTALLSIGLSVEEARHALGNLPACIVDSTSAEYVKEIEQQLKRTGAEVSLEVEEEEEFEIDLDFAEEQQQYQKRGTQLYKLTEDGVALEEEDEGPDEAEEIDAGEIEALLQGLEQLQMISSSDPVVDIEKLATPKETEPESSTDNSTPELKTEEELIVPEIDTATENPEAREEVAEAAAPEEHLEEAPKEDSEEIIDSVNQEVEAPSEPAIDRLSRTSSKKDNNRTKTYLPLILFSLLGSAVLLATGILAVKFLRPEESSVSYEQVLKQLSEVNEKSTPEEKEVVKETAPPDYKNGTYVGFLKEDKFSVASKFSVADGKLEAVELIITTVEPPPLTDLEIVENKIRDPWIHTIKTVNVSVDQKAAESFLVTAVARAYVDYNDQRFRLTADCVLSGNISLETGTIKAELFINRGFPEIPEKSFLIQKSESEKAEEFNFFLQTELTANHSGSSKSQ